MQTQNRNSIQIAIVVATVALVLWGWTNAIVHANRSVIVLGALCSFGIIGFFLMRLFLPNPRKEYSDRVHLVLRDLSLRWNAERKATTPDIALMIKISNAEREILYAHEYNDKSWLVKTDPNFSLKSWRDKWSL